MSIDVRYMPDGEIEAEACALLAGYARDKRVTVPVPVPLDDLLVHLRLRLDLDDLGARFGVPDALGAILIDNRQIYVDESLDPDERPAMIGRYRFTLAHEIGHWCLHRGRDEVRLAMGDLFGAPAAPSIICRTSERRERVEIQADAFAGCLLMPRDLLIPAWRRRAGRGRRDDVVEPTVRRLAEEFEVSPAAMRIRLERLGLVERDGETTEPLFGAA